MPARCGRHFLRHFSDGWLKWPIGKTSMFYGVGSVESDADSEKLSPRRRKMALFVALLGLSTFVSPMITTDTEILGHTRWSPLQIVLGLHAGRLPLPRWAPLSPVDLAIDVLFGLGTAYVLLTVVALAIAFFPFARFILYTASIGAAAILADGRNRFSDLQDLTYGVPAAFVSGHEVHGRTISLFLLGVLALIIWIAATKQLD